MESVWYTMTKLRSWKAQGKKYVFIYWAQEDRLGYDAITLSVFKLGADLSADDLVM